MGKKETGEEIEKGIRVRLNSRGFMKKRKIDIMREKESEI